MDKIITEIIIGAVILSLLISIIPIYRKSAALVSEAGEKVDVNENIKEVIFGRLPENGDVVSGRYLLELFNYLKEKFNIDISVEFSDRMYIFKNDSNVDSLRVIEENMMFKVKQSEINENNLKIYFVLYKDVYIEQEAAWLLPGLINIYEGRFDMEKVIATIVIIVLTMGLISYAIVGQMGGFRDNADVVTEEQSRLETMIKDSSVVPLSTVRNYINKSTSANYRVSVDGKIVSSTDELVNYNDNTLFTMSKTYDEYGKISRVSFSLKNQSFAQAG